uniref:Copia protein n=1 Tax=Zeugodacus cucurbitae TaxID=28588 RepID=A0A0A1XNE2_ZEUCU
MDVLKVIDENIYENIVDDTRKKAERCAKSLLIEYLSDSFLNFATSDISAHQATKRGIVRLHNGHEITLEDVLYCKEAAGNLMSVKRLQEAGMTIKFDVNGVTISKNGSIVVQNSGNQLADIFTKPLPTARFVELRKKLGLLQDD